MDPTAIDDRMAKTIQALKKGLQKIRTGRAHAGLLDQVKVACYGQEMLLPQTATVAVGGGRLLTVQPYDATNLVAIEKAIREADLGLNPSNDGSRVLINLPELSEDRRVELVKLVKREAEESRVAVRNIRRDELNGLRAQLKAKELGEEDLRRFEKQLQETIDSNVKAIDEMAAVKSRELMQV